MTTNSENTAPRIGFLYWNVRENDVSDHLAWITASADIDILILSEWEGSTAKLVVKLNQNRKGEPQYTQTLGHVKDPIILSRLPIDAIKPKLDEPGISIRTVMLPFTPEFILASVHLTSKMYHSDDEQAQLVSRLARTIESTEDELGHTRTILVGDFNMNPFERGLVGSERLHATMSRAIALKGSRVVSGQARPFFYNPMWSHLGDHPETTPGTYFLWRSTPNAMFWYMFDQVLIRPSLLPWFNTSDVAILTMAGSQSLLDHNGRPDVTNISDHLPLTFSLHISGGPNNAD